MPVRRRVQAVRERGVNAMSAFRWSTYGDGLEHMLGDPCFRTRAEAERAWQTVRRLVWAEEAIGRVPKSAKTFDGITEEGVERLCIGWQCITVPVREVLDALEGDRRRLAEFEQTPAARSIADYLAALRGAWDGLEAVAVGLATTRYTDRPYPARAITGHGRYERTQGMTDEHYRRIVAELVGQVAGRPASAASIGMTCRRASRCSGVRSTHSREPSA